ncbi:MAG: hypothetical protein HOP31_02330 [Ignavibacteria bacterium]|nr:hypothetical protein [Ignavibacteria bacterium]
MKLEDIAKQLGSIEAKLDSVDDRLDGLHNKFNDYVHKHQFQPVKLLVYGFAGLVFSTVILAILALVIIKPFSL